MDYYEEEYPTSYFGMAWAMIASVGWYIVGILVALWYASPYIQEQYAKWKSKRDEQEYSSKYHKDPDLFQQRLSSLEASRQRMQEEYQARMELARQKEEERKEKKRQELLALAEGKGGKRLGTGDDVPSTSTGSDSKAKLKGDYNPLMGDSTRRYRPPKRSCCGKGGCG